MEDGNYTNEKDLHVIVMSCVNKIVLPLNIYNLINVQMEGNLVN